MSVINHEQQATSAQPPDARQDVRVTRWVATIAGLLGFVRILQRPGKA